MPYDYEKSRSFALQLQAACGVCPECRSETGLTRFEGFLVCRGGHCITCWPWGKNRHVRVVPVARTDRYDHVSVKENGVRRTVNLHTLVIRAFGGPRPSSDHEARHLDGNKRNNAADNLAWGTHDDNTADRKAHGRDPVGSMNPKAKLNDELAQEIKRKLNAGESPTDIAPMFGVSRATIYDIRHGRKWTHV